MKTKLTFLKKSCIFTIILILTLSLLSGCGLRNATVPSTISFLSFDTIVTIAVYDTSDDMLLKQCEELCHTYENLFSRTKEGSDIYRINHAKGLETKVNPETYALISSALSYCELTNGKLDISIAPVKDLWDFTLNEHGTKEDLPNDTSIEEALTHVDYKKIILNKENTSVTLLDPDAEIDLGCIAKGYIADQLVTYLKSKGVDHALINLGGNVAALGSKPDGSDFSVGIEKPFATSTPITTVKIHDASVVTSGIYERYLKVDHKIYHHILNTSTGFPVENNLYSVTILTSSSEQADALSTVCLCLGLEEATKLIESIDGTDAIFITNSYDIIDTRDLPNP